MRTACPACHTAFRIRAEQLRIRDGRVRCGNCRTAFNALDKLEDEAYALPSSGEPARSLGSTTSAVAAEGCTLTSAAAVSVSPTVVAPERKAPTQPDASEPIVTPPEREGAPFLAPPVLARAESARGTASAAGVGRKWLSGIGGGGSSAPAHDRRQRVVLAASSLFLVLLLIAQLTFLWRSEIAVAWPGSQPTLAAFSEILGSEMPLPRKADLVSIEASDLQNEPGRNRVLVLQTTLRNRASFAQAYPALELTLTDARDQPLTRRVFLADEYLPASVVADPSFPANGELEIRLWLEAKDIDAAAAGYRLYVFYP